jgi:NAD(P)-dependent dehydrogenase (short-subunit alcohol dehydrogenase family)
MPVAVITGGGSGLGLVLGQRCAAQGMELVLLDSRR